MKIFSLRYKGKNTHLSEAHMQIQDPGYVL